MEQSDMLAERGKKLYESLKSPDPATDALALEAARITDRLDVLNAEISSADTMDDAPLSEARQQQIALKNILTTIATIGATNMRLSDDLPENVSPLQKIMRNAGA